MGWRAGWNKQGGFNCGIGPSISLGNDARLDFGVGRNGMFAGLGNKNGMIGFGSGGIGGTLNIARGLGVNFGNGGFGVNLGGIVDIGSHGVSFVNPFILLGTQVFNYFAEIKPLRGQRHKLDALAQKETDPIKKALFEYFTDEARIKEESSRANIGGDLTLLRFLGNNSDKAFGVINAEISKAISSMKEKLGNNENAQEEITYLLLTLSSPNMGRHINKAQIALELSAIIKAGGDNANFITDLWAAFPAELKPKEDDQAALTIFEGKDKYAVSVRTKDLVEAVLGGKYEEFQKDLLLGEKALDQIKKVRDLLRRDDLRSSFDRSSAMSRQSRSKHDFDTMVYDLTKATRKLIEENANGSNNDQIYVNSLVLLSLANQVGRQTIIPILSRLISDVPTEIQERLKARFEGFYQSRALAVLDLKDTGIDFTVSERTGEKDSNDRYIRIERTIHYSMTEFVHRSISRTIREETAERGSGQ